MVDTIKNDGAEILKKLEEIIQDVEEIIPDIIEEFKKLLEQDIEELKHKLQDIISKVEDGEQQVVNCIKEYAGELQALQERLQIETRKCTESQVAQAKKIAEEVKSDILSVKKQVTKIINEIKNCNNVLCYIPIIGEVKAVVDEATSDIQQVKTEVAALVHSWINEAQVCIADVAEKIAHEEQLVIGKIEQCVKDHLGK